jgi:hypothetical protein
MSSAQIRATSSTGSSVCSTSIPLPRPDNDMAARGASGDGEEPGSRAQGDTQGPLRQLPASDSMTALASARVSRRRRAASPIFSPHGRPHRGHRRLNGKWTFGTETAAELFERTKPYTMAGIADRITCPTLVLAAENDQFFRGQPERVFDALRCERSSPPFPRPKAAANTATKARPCISTRSPSTGWTEYSLVEAPWRGQGLGKVTRYPLRPTSRDWVSAFRPATSARR